MIIQATEPPEFIRLLAHNVRWALLKALAIGDHRVQELVTLVNEPMNLVSYHLKKLREDAIVTTRRSDADGRDIYYSLDLNRLRRMYFDAGMALHPAIGINVPDVDVSQLEHKRVLFVCTHNSARSQMAEGLLRHLSQGYLEVFSAGSEPTTVHPDAIRTMDALGIEIRNQLARPLSDFADQSFDYVITVCDKAREVCPTFPGQGQQIHWSFPDPVIIKDNTERIRVFEKIAEQLQSRIGLFLTAVAKESM